MLSMESRIPNRKALERAFDKARNGDTRQLFELVRIDEDIAVHVVVRREDMARTVATHGTPLESLTYGGQKFRSLHTSQFVEFALHSDAQFNWRLVHESVFRWFGAAEAMMGNEYATLLHLPAVTFEGGGFRISVMYLIRYTWDARGFRTSPPVVIRDGEQYKDLSARGVSNYNPRSEFL